MPDSAFTFVEKVLSASIGNEISVTHSHPVGGGCINRASRLETSVGRFFLKTNDARKYPGMFEAEAKGLKLLHSAREIHVPQVVGFGEEEGESFILLEYIESFRPNKNFWENFGASLAKLHGHSASRFGLDHDNYIGSLPQSNKQHDDWITFFIEERLQKQMQLAFDSGKITDIHQRQFESLYLRLENFFPKEQPSLLHGDLWSGNFMTDSEGNACLIDPAVYYGHREAELAFTQLFRGFDKRFYSSYNESFPLQLGFEKRKDVYNLYPLLVHVNLFGGGYLSSVEGILKNL